MHQKKTTAKTTSWDPVSQWYDKLVGKHGSEYHQQVLLPGAMRLLNPKKGEAILDVGCGQGIFCRKLREAGARVTGIDASKKLIAAASQRSSDIKYLVADAANLPVLPSQSFDALSCVMAIQNMDNLEQIFKEAARLLKTNGRMLLILSHPCFRIPRQSGWGFDEKRKLQFRRIDSYLSPQKIPIQMHPGYNPNIITHTFHRPLNIYFSALAVNGFVVSTLEEWASHRQSLPGTRQKAENRARSEIPLFLALVATKLVL